MILRCHKPGCTETGFAEYDTQRERMEITSGRASTWMCGRHMDEHRNLTLESGAKTAVLVATKTEYGQFWYPEGKTTGSGLNRSEAHKAYAEDFPEGTRLVITAYVETPEQAAIATEVDAEVPS